MLIPRFGDPTSTRGGSIRVHLLALVSAFVLVATSTAGAAESHHSLSLMPALGFFDARQTYGGSKLGDAPGLEAR